MTADEAIRQTAAEARLEVEERDRQAAAFVDFVLRHTLPVRAKAHGFEAVHSLILHHPFAKQHHPKQEGE